VSLETALPALSLRRRIAVVVLLASALVLGAVAVAFVPLELIPQGFSSPHLRVFAPWPDAPPEEVVEKIIRPLEEELATVPGVEGMNSLAMSSFGRIFLRFNPNTDMDVAYREVRDRVERAKARLPPDVPQVFIGKDDASGIPVAVWGLTIPPGITDAYDLVRNEIVMPLERLDGVASVNVEGQLQREILIELDRQRTAAAGLNIYQLAQELSRDHFTLASGHAYAGDRKLLLRSVARYEDIDDLRHRRVGPDVRLRDVATVRYDEPEKTFRVRAMSLPAVAVQVLKEGEANTLEVSERVEAAMAEIQANPRLAEIGFAKLFNQGEVIEESLATLFDSGKIGGLFAILVLFFFLRRFRMTLIITLSIPLSLLVAVTAMYFFGETLNIITLLGLMISVGLLVDNSVVVAENIFRRHQEGASRREACVEGAGEIALAITLATLTTMVVFLPAALVGGEGQFFLLRLALPICAALLASLVVALLLIPLAVYLTLPANGGHGNGLVRRAHLRVNGVFRRGYEASFGRMNALYNRLLAVALRRRLDAVLLLVVVLVVSLGAFGQKVRFVEMQEDEQRGFFIGVQLPPATTLGEAEAFFRQAEQIVEARRERYDLDGWLVIHRATNGEIQGWFPMGRKGGMTPRQITEDLLEELPQRPGVRYFTGQTQERERDDKGLFRVTLHGEDPRELERAAEGLTERLLAVEGVVGERLEADRPAEELALVIDRERAQRLGVSPEVLAQAVGYALRGQSLPRFSRDGREIPVRVRYREEDRQTLEQLADFAVPTIDGEEVPLRALTDVEFLPASQRIVRRDRRTSQTIQLDLAEGVERETRDRLAAAVAQVRLPEGVSLTGGQATGAPEGLGDLLFALALSIVFIYLLMAFLFESFMLPLSIIFTIPLAFLGVAWGHLIAGLDIDFLGVVGVVLLVGVVVNNGIVLIDTVNRQRRAGRERQEALLAAADRRFRPIMMTALTTICGMIPLLLASASSIGLSYKSFAIALVGGLAAATLLTLLVVPVFYTLFDDLRAYLSGLLGWLGAKGSRTAGAATEGAT
jgi:hydrophobic/amphiphilic exporter-1 (mainly G- bacteria), HAE1 family